MKKLILSGLAVGILIFTAACDKKSSGNNPIGFAPNSCFTSGGPQQYQWRNGQCIDIRSNQPVSQQFCQNANFGLANDPRCNYYGGFQGIPGGGQFGVGFDACSSAYGPGWVTSRGVFGELICVNAQTWGYISGFYGAGPSLVNGLYQTCIPGQFNCNCQNFGGTLGWISGGGYVGYCF